MGNHLNFTEKIIEIGIENKTFSQDIILNIFFAPQNYSNRLNTLFIDSKAKTVEIENLI